ncbi:MAG TPA: terminase, partial [Reyranella sp.]|nr:terminase [Reyranella sp.]
MEQNTEAIAGLHNKGRRAFALLDEASAIPDPVWDTVEGALTDADTELLWAVFGNPTRTAGRFRECFAGGRFAHRWSPQQIDSRSVGMTNKAQIAAWVKDHGEDSDF